MLSLSIILAYVALAAGLVAGLAMLFRLGRGATGKPGTVFLWVHKIAGYFFIAVMGSLFAAMLYKVTEFGAEFSPRVGWHAAVGLAVFSFALFKWAVVRPFRGMMKFAPPLGIVVLALAFIVVMLSATVELLSEAGRTGVETLPPETEITGLSEVEGDDELPAARFVFAEKCGKCHHCRRPFEKPPADGNWAPLIKRMRSYKPAWINDAEAAEIKLYLDGDYGPGK
jgi:hypothetical protein